jgi:predicted dehydrogenase
VLPADRNLSIAENSRTKDRPLGVVIVGAGLMGRWHAYYARRLGATIVGIVDKDPLKARTLVEQHRSTPVFSELEDCLVRCKPDVVHICTPSSSHFDLAKLALEAKAHVLLEKPAAPTLETTEELLELARCRGKLLNPVHQFPFQEGFRRLRLKAAALGDPVRVSYEAFTAGGTGRSPEERRQILIEILPHPLSLGTGLFGPSFLNTVEFAGPATSDHFELWGTACGARFHVCLSHRGRPTRNVLSYTGTAGSAYVNLYHGFAVFETASKTSRVRKTLQPLNFGARLVGRSVVNLSARLRRSVWAYPGLPELGRAFYDAVRNGGPAPIAEAEIAEIARTVDRLQTT